MRHGLSSLASVLTFALASTAAADPPAPAPAAQPTTPTTPTPATHKMTLDDVTAHALAGPRARMAAGDRDAAAARVDEADAARLPRITATAFGTISPEITCNAGTMCTETSPTNFAFRFSGLYGGAELDVTQPLYTFGKLAHARAAARAGLDAQAALGNEAAGDLAVDAARAYWSVKLARELGGMLDDGIDEIDNAIKGMDERAKESHGDISITDRQRVAVLLANAKAQRIDAAQGEAAALAGLRAITGVDDADVDDVTLDAIPRALPTDHGAASIAAAPEHRPQAIAARDGARAADELAGLEHSNYFPDVALVGSALIDAAQGVQDPPGAFFYNPYNREGAGLVLGLKWTLEPWNVKARADRTRADARRMHAQADLAAVGARYDTASALAEATGAHDKLAVTIEGEKAARTWLAAVLQNEAIGTAESRDLADAYYAWFTIRAQWAAAVLQWNVAVVRLDRASGEFRAAGKRPKE